MKSCVHHISTGDEAYLYSAVLLHGAVSNIPKDWNDGIVKLIDALKCIAKPDGNLPSLGDGDDGTYLIWIRTVSV